MIRLKELRIQKKLNMRQVAHKLNIAYTTYFNYEKEKREPNSEMLILLADSFDVTVDYLIGRSETQTAHLVTNAEQEQLLADYNKLNTHGKKKILDYLSDIITIEKYKT